jgi:hypothetical protein
MVLASAVALAPGMARAGQYVVTPIDIPGATGSIGYSVNASNQVAGVATFPRPGGGTIASGFIWSNGHAAIFNGKLDDHAVDTTLYSINDNGVAVGSVCTVDVTHNHCSPLIARTTSVTQPQVFGPQTNAQAWALDNRVQVVGGGVGSGAPFQSPFEYKPGTPTQILNVPVNNGFATSINRHGVIAGVGEPYASQNTAAFIYANGQASVIQPPDGGSVINLVSINNTGAICGSYNDVKHHAFGFIRYPTGNFRKLNYPGSDLTAMLHLTYPHTRARFAAVRSDGHAVRPFRLALP